MKPVRCLRILLLAITTVAFIPKQPVDDACLRISGIATQDGQLIEEATVKLFLGNKEIAYVKTDKRNKGFHFTLKRNAYYAVEISKSGFVPRILIISTQLANNIAAKPLFSFEFEMELFPETGSLNQDFLDFPVAIIAYDKSKKLFDYKKKYTSHIKHKINQPQEIAPVVQK